MSNPEYLRLIRDWCDAVAPIEQLHRQAVRQYTPVVEAILGSRSCDLRELEHTLDGLLDFCGHGPALLLYPHCQKGQKPSDLLRWSHFLFTAPTEEQVKKVGAVRR